MALKGDRLVVGTRFEYYMDEVAERGGVAVVSTVGSGAALDQSRNLATYAANSSGKTPIGILMYDMVDVDLSKYKLNQHRYETNKGAKILIMDKGWVRTNMYDTTPTNVGPAYLSSSGKVTPTNGGAAATPLVGRFETTPDEDGYLKLNINLP